VVTSFPVEISRTKFLLSGYNVIPRSRNTYLDTCSNFSIIFFDLSSSIIFIMTNYVIPPFILFLLFHPIPFFLFLFSFPFFFLLLPTTSKHFYIHLKHSTSFYPKYLLQNIPIHSSPLSHHQNWPTLSLPSSSQKNPNFSFLPHFL